MPVVLRVGPYRFFFYAADRAEPPHVHVKREDMAAKFWLEPVALARSGYFSRVELARIERLVDEHQADLLRQWHEFHK